MICKSAKMNFSETRNWQLETSPRLHTDLMNVSYFHTYKLFDLIIEKGNMK